MKLCHPLASANRAHPTSTAVRLGDNGVDYQDLQRRVAGWAGWLAAMGVRPGDTVALVGPVGMPWLEGLLAVSWLGATALPLSPEAQAVPFWAQPVDSGPPMFIWCPGEAGERRSLGEVGGWPSAAPSGGAAVRTSWLAHDPDGWCSQARPEPVWEDDAVLLRLATSGTTGLPRRVDLTAGALMTAAMGTALRLGHLPGDRWLCCLPLHHIGGFMVIWRALWTASTILWQPRFDAAAAAFALFDGQVTLAALVPTMLRRILDLALEGRSPRSLRAVMLGGAPASPGLLADASARGLPLAPCWGMSESAAAVACAHPGAPAVAGDCGPPLAFARVAVGADGRLQLVGPQLGPRAAVAPWATSDLGYLSAGGHVHVMGRGDDVIISGGVNLSPEPIEAALMTLPGVTAAAVVPLPSRQWGQRPAALLVMAAGQEAPSLAALRGHVRAQLSGAQVPDRAWVCRQLVMGPLGKLRRQAMAELLRQRLEGSGQAGSGPGGSKARHTAPLSAACRLQIGAELVSDLAAEPVGPGYRETE